MDDEQKEETTFEGADEPFRRALIKIEADVAEARSVTWTLGAGMEPALEVRLANGAEHLIARVRGLEVDLAAAEARAAEAVIAEAPHQDGCEMAWPPTYARPERECDCWKADPRPASLARVKAEAWDEGLSAGADRWMDSREFGDKPVNPYRAGADQ